MRVKELAQIAGTTPRAVRHYHHLGLLEVPPTVRGRREYGVEHVARLLRIRWLADGGLSLTQVAEMLASDTIGTDQDSRREAVLRDLRATRGTIEAQQRSLAEQASRVDELIARVERGEGLSPAPSALTRFYDDMEARIAHLGGSMRGLRAERQMMVVLASLGMVPDSTIPFIEGLDEADRELSAQQIADFTRLSTLTEAEGRAEARRLAHNSWALACRHKERTLAVLDDLPSGTLGRAMWRLTHVLNASSYPHPAQQAFVAELMGLMLADPDFAATIRRSAGEEPVL